MRVITAMTLKEIIECLSTKAQPLSLPEAQHLRALAREVQRSNWLENFGQRSRSVLEYADKILNTCGIESFRIKVQGRVRQVTYCNAGDTYATTVLYYNNKYWAGCWGDLAERYEQS